MRFRIVPHSLGRRIMLSLALGIGVILALFGLVVLWTIRDSADAAYRERVTLAATLATRVDDMLRYALITLEREATDLEIEPGRPLSEWQRRQLADLRFRLGSPVTVSLMDAHGTIIWPDQSEVVTRTDSRFKPPSTSIVLATGKPAIGEFSSAPGSPTLASLAVPLRDRQGRIVGTLAAELDPGYPALNLLPSGEMGHKTLVQLMNSEGQILAGTAGFSEILAQAHRVLLADLIGAQTAGYRIHEVPPGSAFSSHIVAYAPVPLLPAWGVALEQPRDIVLATPLLLQQRLVFFGLVAILSAMVAAWLGARRLARPIEQLTVAAERFASGMLDAPVKLDRADELGTLARAFETMRRQLQRSRAEIVAHNAELERRVEERTREVEDRNRQLARVNALATTVSSSLRRDDILERAMEQLVEVTGMEYGRFRLLPHNADGLNTAAGDRPESSSAAGICSEACLCGRVAKLGVPLVAQDIGTEQEAVVCQEAGFKSVIAVPLAAQDQVMGVLFLASAAGRSFEQREIDTLSAIGRQIGMALGNSKLFEEVQQREQTMVRLLEQIIGAQEGERKRIARDLHDSTGQALSAIIMGLQAMDEIASAGDRLARQLGRTRGLAESALADLRELIMDLRPIVLDDLGLVPAIRSYAERHLGELGVMVNFSATGMKERLPAQVETSLFRALQEAITNIAKHAQAKVVRVQLSRTTGSVTVLIEDDGVGFDFTTIDEPRYSGEGLGLLGMRERIDLLAGDVQVESSPGAGTRIKIVVPLSVSEKAMSERALS